MRITKNQTTNRTLADLYRGMHRQHVVTITHLKAGETEPTIRTIEIHELRTTADGSIVIIAMCRLRQAERRFHVSDVLAYTLHKIGFVLTRPEPTTYERPAPQPYDDAQALYLYELARDKDDADYRPRRKLVKTDTDLAA